MATTGTLSLAVAKTLAKGHGLPLAFISHVLLPEGIGSWSWCLKLANYMPVLLLEGVGRPELIVALLVGTHDLGLQLECISKICQTSSLRNKWRAGHLKGRTFLPPGLSPVTSV